MGAPRANRVWLPMLLMIMSLVMAQNETASSSRGGGYDESNSPSSSTTASTSTDADLVIGGDLNKAARVEEMSGDLVTETDTVTNTNREGSTDNSTPRSTEGSGGGDAGGGPYDVIDVLAATSAGVGRPKTTGQTTRIYTTGDVNEDFWLKHLGDDFKHAIHLQVGGTNEDYNRIINQTSGGVHEEVHHEYLPGAERPQGQYPQHEQQQQQQYPQQQQQQQQQYPQQQQPQQQLQHPLRTGGYGQPNLVSQLSLDGEAMALKQNYLRQQQQQQQRFAQGYAQPYLPSNNNNNNNNRHTYSTHPTQHTVQHTQTAHTQHTVQHTQAQHTPTQYTRPGKSRHQLRNRYKQREQPAPSSIINSSEDTLHTSQSQTTPTSTQHHPGSPDSSSSLRRDGGDSQLPFKSPFNDYGSRTTRDLTYLLYKRGL